MSNQTDRVLAILAMSTTRLPSVLPITAAPSHPDPLYAARKEAGGPRLSSRPPSILLRIDHQPRTTSYKKAVQVGRHTTFPGARGGSLRLVVLDHASKFRCWFGTFILVHGTVLLPWTDA